MNFFAQSRKDNKEGEISKLNSCIALQQKQHLLTHSKKRKLTDDDLRTSSFKIRVLVPQLRPLFIQTPDFRNCKAAHELRMQRKPLMDLCEQMKEKTNIPEKLGSECRMFSLESDRQDGKILDSLQFEQHSSQFSQKETIEYIEPTMKARVCYIVGGSVFGWNGNDPVYYGVTKEPFKNSIKSNISRVRVSSHRADFKSDQKLKVLQSEIPFL